MKVKLAGANVDFRLLDKIKKSYLTEKEKEALTPEVITAAYARISRSSKNIDELITESRNDTESARRSIYDILGMGHHSIADHVIFNFNITEVSRLMVESIEERRLAGYTEKSQRYVALQGDYIRPKEFSSEDLRKFEELVSLQNKFYFEANKKLFEYLTKKNKKKIDGLEGKEKEKFLRRLKESAKEDARYSLSLATMTQLGCSYTGQTLELAIRKNKYGELEEQKEFARQLYIETVNVAPSLIQLSDRRLFGQLNPGKKLDDDNFKYTKKNLEELAAKTIKEIREYPFNPIIYSEGNVKLALGYGMQDFDTHIIAAVIHTNSLLEIEKSYRIARTVREGYASAKKFIEEALKHISEYDKVPREFEISGLIYEIILSASAFAQLKRHRMNTLLKQNYNPGLGYTIPESIEEIKMADKLKEVCDKSSEIYYNFSRKYKKAAEYCLTNAHRRRIILACNIRQLYHISRTREDKHAQWEIREIVARMSKLARTVAPITTLLLGGKDNFQEIRKKIYGEKNV